MCPKGGQMCQMESVRLSINEHMTSVVGEDILCVLEKQSDACCVKLVRVFVLERLSAAAEWMCNLFQREIETLETLLDHQSKLLDMAFNVDTQLHTAGSGAPVKMIGPEAARSLSIKQEPEDQLDTNYLHPPSASEELVCPGPSPALHPRPSASEELVSPGPSLVQGGEAEGGGPLQRPQEGAGGSSFMAGKSEEEEEEEDDDDGDEDEDDDEDDTEPLASTSTELMQDGGTAPPPVDVQLISSDSEEWEESGRGDGVSAFNTLKPHKSHHAEGQRWFICPVCGKSFNRNDNLKIHMRIHTGDKPFSCPVCGKSFTLNENMKTHMRIHTNEKPFSCTLCDKSFVQKIKLKLHMTAHTGEKPFYCAVCNKSFNRTENLKTHMLTHTGEKPYGCSLCDQRFSQNSTLKRHMRVHTGEKPFSCTLCEQSFTVNHHLKRHMLTHAAEKP